MEKLKADLAGLQKRAGELATKRAAAQADLNRAMAAREKHHSEGDLDDDKVGIRLQAAMDSATSSLAGFNEAIRMQAGLVAEAKAKVEAERRAAAQRLAGAELSGQLDVVEQIFPRWLALTREFTGLLERLPQWESAQLAGFIRDKVSEAEAEGLVVFPDLRRMAIAIGEGRAAIPPRVIPVSEQPRLALVEAPPIRSVFAVKAMRYDGCRVILGANRVVDLPLALAERALKIGAAIEAGDPRRRALELRSQSMTLPDPANCIALDDSPLDEPKSMQRKDVYRGPITSSHFEPVDRGPPITGTMPVPPAAVGQRTMPTDEE